MPTTVSVAPIQRPEFATGLTPESCDRGFGPFSWPAERRPAFEERHCSTLDGEADGELVPNALRDPLVGVCREELRDAEFLEVGEGHEPCFVAS